MADEHNCTQGDHNCDEMMERITLSLDGALSETEAQSLMEEVKNFPCCLKKYDIQKSYKVFLCTKICKKETPTELVDRIRVRIQDIPIEKV